MVRMLDIRSICFSRLFDDGFRLTHQARSGVKLRVNARRRVRKAQGASDQPALAPSDQPALAPSDQPALAPSQAMGSIRPPLTQTSKCRWFAVERPVLPTKPISWPAATVSPAWTCREP